MLPKELNVNHLAPSEDFIAFLRFCSDRLNKDEPVQAIWSAWKELAEKK